MSDNNCVNGDNNNTFPMKLSKAINFLSGTSFNWYLFDISLDEVVVAVLLFRLSTCRYPVDECMRVMFQRTEWGCRISAKYSTLDI